MRRWGWLVAAVLPIAAMAQTRPPAPTPAPAPAAPTAPAAPRAAPAPERAGPPHEWAFGVWTGGLFAPGEPDVPACFGGPTVIITRDIVFRASVLEVSYRQRTIETAATQPNGLELRFTPPTPVLTALGPRLPPDVGFGCPAGPNALRVERRGPNEIAFPDCTEFPYSLQRCVAR